MHSASARILALLLVPAGGATFASSPAQPPPRGRVEWTRLITPSEYWNRHMEGDRSMLRYIREKTPLQVEESWRATSPDNLEDLCRYPFIYAHDLRDLTAKQARNIAEFIRRGGFVFVDFCVNVKINPAPREFMQLQYQTLRPHLPGVKVFQLTPQHEIYSVYFKMRHFPPQTRPGDSQWVDGETNPMYGLEYEGRLVAVVGLSGFQCSWDGVGGYENAVECMQMVANIHIYAMTH